MIILLIFSNNISQYIPLKFLKLQPNSKDSLIKEVQIKYENILNKTPEECKVIICIIFK